MLHYALAVSAYLPTCVLCMSFLFSSSTFFFFFILRFSTFIPFAFRESGEESWFSCLRGNRHTCLRRHFRPSLGHTECVLLLLFFEQSDSSFVCVGALGLILKHSHRNRHSFRSLAQIKSDHPASKNLYSSPTNSHFPAMSWETCPFRLPRCPILFVEHWPCHATLVCYPWDDAFHLPLLFTLADQKHLPFGQTWNVTVDSLRFMSAICLWPISQLSLPFANITHFKPRLIIVNIIRISTSAMAPRSSCSQSTHPLTTRSQPTGNIYECMCPLLRAIPFICCTALVYVHVHKCTRGECGFYFLILFGFVWSGPGLLLQSPRLCIRVCCWFLFAR